MGVEHLNVWPSSSLPSVRVAISIKVIGIAMIVIIKLTLILLLIVIVKTNSKSNNSGNKNISLYGSRDPVSAGCFISRELPCGRRP